MRRDENCVVHVTLRWNENMTFNESSEERGYRRVDQTTLLTVSNQDCSTRTRRWNSLIDIPQSSLKVKPDTSNLIPLSSLREPT